MLALFVLSIVMMSLAGWWIGSKTRRFWVVCLAAIGFYFVLGWTCNAVFPPDGVIRSACYEFYAVVWSGYFGRMAIAVVSILVVAPVMSFIAAASLRARQVSSRKEP